jgi:DNA-directed RNA polymerase I subunit RPA43
VIPKTTTYKQFKEKKSKEAATEAGAGKGQRLLNGRGMLRNGGDHAGREQSALDGRDESSQSASAGIPMVIHSSHARSLMTEGVIETTRQDDDDVDMLDS